MSTGPTSRFLENKQSFRLLAAEVRPWEYLDYKQYLGDLYAHLKRAYDDYSYINFTIDLGFGNCNAMHLIVHGNRPLTTKGAQKIIDTLDLRKVERRYFLALVEYTNAADPTTRDECLKELLELKSRALPTELDRKQLDFIGQWYHVALLELLKLPDAQCDAQWLSDHIQPRVAVGKVEKTLTLLEELGYMKRGKNQGGSRGFSISSDVISTGPEVAGVGALNYHHQMLELARDSIAKVDPQERDISGLTLGVDPLTRDQIKQEVVAFRKRIIDIVTTRDAQNESSGDLNSQASEVIQLNFQLFPLTKTLRKAGRS